MIKKVWYGYGEKKKQESCRVVQWSHRACRLICGTRRRLCLAEREPKPYHAFGAVRVRALQLYKPKRGNRLLPIPRKGPKIAPPCGTTATPIPTPWQAPASTIPPQRWRDPPPQRWRGPPATWWRGGAMAGDRYQVVTGRVCVAGDSMPRPVPTPWRALAARAPPPSEGGPPT